MLGEIVVGEGTSECTGGFFQPLATGTVVSTQIPGVTINGASNRGGVTGNRAMIFDSANPTGNDPDLAPQNFGKILIISEDGDYNDHDD